jgi:hypothetical protein
MLYRIKNATAHPDHSVTVTWSDGITARVDLSPVVGKGNVFAPMRLEPQMNADRARK